jgi:hypothetical protein
VIHSTVLAGDSGPHDVPARVIPVEASPAHCGAPLCSPRSVFIAGSSRRTPLTPGAGPSNDVVLQCRFGRCQQLAFESFKAGIRHGPFGDVTSPACARLNDNHAISLAFTKPLASADRIGLELGVVANDDCGFAVFEIDDNDLLIADRNRVGSATQTDVIVDHEAHLDVKLADLPPDVVDCYLDRMRHLRPVLRVDDL